MRIDPCFPKTELTGLGVDTEVWTLRIPESFDIPNLSCGVAWTSKAEAKKHFWFKAWSIQMLGRPHIIKTTLGEFIKLEMNEGVSANPFETIGRLEFFAKWMEHTRHEANPDQTHGHQAEAQEEARRSCGDARGGD